MPKRERDIFKTAFGDGPFSGIGSFVFPTPRKRNCDVSPDDDPSDSDENTPPSTPPHKKVRPDPGEFHTPPRQKSTDELDAAKTELWAQFTPGDLIYGATLSRSLFAKNMAINRDTYEGSLQTKVGDAYAVTLDALNQLVFSTPEGKSQRFTDLSGLHYQPLTESEISTLPLQAAQFYRFLDCSKYSPRQTTTDHEDKIKQACKAGILWAWKMADTHEAFKIHFLMGNIEWTRVVEKRYVDQHGRSRPDDSVVGSEFRLLYRLWLTLDADEREKFKRVFKFYDQEGDEVACPFENPYTLAILKHYKNPDAEDKDMMMSSEEPQKSLMPLRLAELPNIATVGFFATPDTQIMPEEAVQISSSVAARRQLTL